MTNEPTGSAAGKVLNAIHEMRTGEIGLVEGCRIIVRYLGEIDPTIARSEAAAVVSGVESETDRFPLGDVRKLWSADALNALDRELNHYLDAVGEPLLEACRILERELIARDG